MQYHCYALVGYNPSSCMPFVLFNPWGTDANGWAPGHSGKVYGLFSADATYRYHPYDEGDDVVHGRDEIVRSWLEPAGTASDRDEPDTYEAHYEPWVVDGDRAVAVGWSRYWTWGCGSARAPERWPRCRWC